MANAFRGDAESCQAANRPGFEVVVFPDSTHAFVSPMWRPSSFKGQPIVYNEKAALDAQARADAFIAVQMK